jgi:hypothetical protein
LVIACASISRGAELVTDEVTRLKVLEAMFPGMSITATPTRHLDDSEKFPAGKVTLDFPDALKGEMVYQITGAPASDNERCASEDVLQEHARSSVREARFKAYKVAETDFVAVAQYKFVGANPAMACPSIARIVRVGSQNGVLKVSSEFDPDTTHHWSVQRIETAPLAGDASDYLLVESNAGGAGTIDSELYLFDLSAQKLWPVLATDARLSASIEKEDLFVQHLDVARTRSRRGSRFCFTTTTYVEEDKTFNPPKVTHPCYRRGEGVDDQ